MSIIIMTAVWYGVQLSEQDAYLALSEAAMWLVLVLVLFIIPRKR